MSIAGEPSRPGRVRVGTSSKGPLDWVRDGPAWPNAAASRFVQAGGVRWHVQVMGEGPVLLMVHGTGASTHSWRDLLPALAKTFTVVAPDLPGHAFSSTPPASRMSLPGMAAALGALVHTLDLQPRLAVGHSAGAAVLARLCLDRTITPAGLIALNGALLPIGGIAGQIFSPLAKLMASTPLLPHLFARLVDDREAVKRMIAQTGSVLDPVGIGLYGRLMRSPAHAGGALAMMANWDLQPLVRQLPGLETPLLLVVGSKDGSVPPGDATIVRSRVPGSRVASLKGLGHLAHEEKPELVVDLINQQALDWGVLDPTDGAEHPIRAADRSAPSSSS